MFNQVKINNRKTAILITFFLVFIIALGWLFSLLLDSYWIFVFAVIISVTQAFISYWYSDKIVLFLSRAKPIKKEECPELYQIIENLCAKANLPLPKIYLINESQPNAFATGRNKKHSAVAVTRGLLERLGYKELEGVIAHELSHIGNKDILLSTVIVVLVGIISSVSQLFLRLSFWGGAGRGSKDDNQAGGIILLVLGIIAAILAPIAASLIQLAISRKREFLADSSAALLTKNPEGLAQALIKISQDPHPLITATNSTAHLYISSPFKGKQSQSWLIKLFSTHPPIEERIKALRKINV
ncbi:MAG: hypothetical protein BWY03_00548 [Parcubacteria group bacterium ADurb.Bin159]|jgi:heat shock protein HtpX|nr:MAG: hypothetical protein BWY03_00548 [Parcubacteria group bacterium ADurb.Bin159]